MNCVIEYLAPSSGAEEMKTNRSVIGFNACWDVVIQIMVDIMDDPRCKFRQVAEAPMGNTIVDTTQMDMGAIFTGDWEGFNR